MRFGENHHLAKDSIGVHNTNINFQLSVGLGVGIRPTIFTCAARTIGRMRPTQTFRQDGIRVQIVQEDLGLDRAFDDRIILIQNCIPN